MSVRRVQDPDQDCFERVAPRGVAPALIPPASAQQQVRWEMLAPGLPGLACLGMPATLWCI